MSSGSSDKLSAIPTNVITGFLGVGKTSAILSLLKAKPKHERWAVLVNEFGEIGIDGSLFVGQQPESNGVFIREVPGGCMCCAAGLPMQIALNQLLAKARPHRLLIEPTGLGHPKEVLQILSASHYESVLNVQQNITLVDARKLSDQRYTSHDTFNQQIEVADHIIGNKEDLYINSEKASLLAYVAKRKQNLRPVDVTFTQNGRLELEVLEGASNSVKEIKEAQHHHHGTKTPSINEIDFPKSGFLKVENEGEGYRSVGWRFSAENLFDRNKLHNWFNRLQVERMKAVMITSDGIFSYNLVDSTLVETELDDCVESRIEIISRELEPNWQSILLDCRS
ncbi:GTP-binding protein [Alteromonas sp. 5E99-2]|uniref:CobW family GTP-binding protein n=1 Tax=Alteromonas sp. 5E99-2 TaxID=2817683 RepID=UPI001A9848E9|nr:GTP-binding protein [Alteromonas sp. 5E99-2]MBO1255013.1 GTP-binding protein [Alteromonas sp. 5E99-2]